MKRLIQTTVLVASVALAATSFAASTVATTKKLGQQADKMQAQAPVKGAVAKADQAKQQTEALAQKPADQKQPATV